LEPGSSAGNVSPLIKMKIAAAQTLVTKPWRRFWAVSLCNPEKMAKIYSPQ
jgi:hypothetical protein